MALTRITKGVIKPNENYQAGIITATGLDVNGNGDISGDLNVGGILTYEDVTSIDAVGIITAQKGIHIGAGVSAVGVGTFGGLVSPYADIDDFLDVGSNIQLGNAGVVTATSFVGSGADINGDLDVDGHTNLDNTSIVGVATVTGNVNVSNGDIIFTHSNHKIQNGSSASTLNIQGGASNPGGKIELRGGTSDNNIIFLTSDGSGNSVEKLRIHHNGNIGVNSTSPTSKLDVVGDAKITGVVTATTFVGSLTGNVTGEASQVTIGNGANNRIITASGTNTLDCAGNFTFGGNVMELGASGSDGGALYINGGTINNPGGRDAKVWIEDPSNNDWALHINKPSYNYGIQMAMSNSASHAFYIVGGNAEKFRLTGSGEIAKCGSIYPRSADTFDIGDIGSSKWRKIYAQSLHSSDSTKPSLSLYTGSTLRADLAATSGITSIRSYSNSPFTINIGGSGETEAFRITADGDVGLGGVTSPTAKLHVEDTSFYLGRFKRTNGTGSLLLEGDGATEAFYLTLRTNNTTANSGCVIEGSDADGNGTSWIKLFTENHSTNAGGVSIHTRPGGGATTERFKINSDGQLLHTANKASGYIAEFHQNNSSNSAQILIDSPTNSASRPSFIELSRAGTLQWSIGQGYNESTGSFHFATTTLGSGVTGSKFSIEGDGDIAIPTVGAKIYTNNSGGNLTIQGGASYPGSAIKFNGGTNGGTGVMHFYAGQTGSLQERMTLLANGQLLINKTSAVGSGTQLEVTYDGSSTNGRVLAQGFMVRDNYGSPTNIGNGIYSPNANTMAFAANNEEAFRITEHGQLLLGNSSEDQGLAVFWNAPGSGADAGTAGNDGAGDKGVNIRTDMGPTHLNLTGVTNYTMALRNGAYSGAGVSNPQGTISKILFNTVTYNGWNSYGAICLDSQGTSAARGQMVFMLNDGASSMNEKWRITSNETNSSNGQGLNVYGQNVNHSNDAVLYAHKTGNADWCIQASAPGNDYGIYSRVGNGAAYAIGVYDSNNSTWRFRVRGDGVIFASNTTIQGISDVRLKENIVDANSQWDDIKALRFRNFTWKSDSGLDDGKTMLGLIAQEVEPISPNLIDLDAQTKEDIENGVPDPEYKSVKYSIVWMKAVKALQEAQARIEQLEAKVSALEGS